VVEAPHVRRVNRASRTETAAKVGGGAAVGAVLGRIIGRDTRSTVAGAVVGAAAGTAVAVGTADVDGVISPGATATLRLDSSIPVRTEAR
jgi:outer membrane lipoprotein SlyB